jgi:putative ABC transport system permease protein
MNAKPPAAASWLLARLLDDDAYEAVAGDLDEEFTRRASARGRAAAAWWYWRAAAQSIVSCRITGHRAQESHRMDFDRAARWSARDLIRPALRQFRDHPIYAAATSGTLALAIGVGCASLAVVKRAFFDPLPYPDDGALVSVLTEIEGDTSAVSPHVLEDLRASGPPLSGFAAIRPRALPYLTGQGTETMLGNAVTAEYFSLLGVTPAMGRVFAADERDAVVISWRFWNERLQADPAAIGRSLMIDGRSHIITGVLRSDFFGPYWSVAEAWVPLDITALLADVRARRTLTVLARREGAVDQAALDSFMTVFSANLRQQHPSAHSNQSWVAVPLRDELVGSARPALLGAGAAALLLLLIVGANIAGLATAHAAATTHQVAVRAALGATRARLFVEHLTESLMLALLGSIAGVWLARVIVDVLAQYQEQFLGRMARFELDAALALGGVTAGVVIGVAAAVLPRAVVQSQPADSLRAARGSSGSPRVARLRGGLVVAQVALALVLLVGAGLVVRTVRHLAELDLGFNPDRLAVVQLNLPGERYAAREAQVEFERAILERVSQIPGVESATASVGYPIVGGMMAGLALKGADPGAPAGEIAYLSVAPDFMSSIGARLVAGRHLAPTDRANTERVVVINEAMARAYWPQGGAIGSQVHIGPGAANDPWITIVGVIADMRTHGPTEIVRPAAYGSTLQYSWPRRHISIRADRDRLATIGADIRSAIRAIDPNIPAAPLQPVDRLIADRTAWHRLISLALTLFSSVAVVLCVCGLYAVVALTSRMRRREYAVRIALGARGGQVRWLVLRHACILVTAGTLLGLGGALFGTRVLTGLLHGVTPVDGPVFAAASAVLIALATAAAWQPAHYAGRVDPVETLKAE